MGIYVICANTIFYRRACQAETDFDCAAHADDRLPTAVNHSANQLALPRWGLCGLFLPGRSFIERFYAFSAWPTPRNRHWLSYPCPRNGPLILERARTDSNRRPPGSKPGALS